MQWLFAILGVLVVCGAIFDWSWIIDNPKADFISSLFGRIFYVFLGLLITGSGMLLTAEPGLGIVR